MTDRDFLVTLVGVDSDLDLCLGASEDASSSDVLGALRRIDSDLTALEIERLQRPLRADEPLASTGLLSGDRLTVNADRSGPRVEIRKSRTLDFVTGPEAGRWVALGAGGGEVPVGRGSPGGYSISVAEGLEAKHFTVSVDNELQATVTAVGAAISVNDQPLTAGESVQVFDDDLIRAGLHGFAVRSYERHQMSRDRLMQLEFRPTPYRPTLVQDSKIEAIRRIPQESRNGRLQLIAMLLPMVAGLSLLAATLLGNDSSNGVNSARVAPSLVFVAISPLMILGSWYSNKRQGKKTFVQEVAEFNEVLDDRVRQMAAACQQERVSRWRAAPDIPALARRAIYQLPELWQRHRRTDDLLVVRLGEYDTASKVGYEIPDQGESDLIDLAHQRLSQYAMMREVPYTADLKHLGVIALVGKPAAVTRVSASLLVQITALHSPEDVVVVVMSPSADRTSDAVLDLARASRFIPHSRSLSSPISGKHTATKREEADDLLGTLLGIAYDRLQRKASQDAPIWPWLVVFVDERLAPSPLLLSQLGDICSAASMSLIVSAETPSDVTRRARLTFSVGDKHSVATPTNPLERVEKVLATSVSAETFWATMRALAPLRDATESKAVAAIPRIADLFETLGVTGNLRDLISEKWTQSAKFDLKHPIGIGQNGPFNIDLVADGPHMLIGGTSGAGKSELLMSMIASLAVHHPPERVNFLFFDYKGGAGTQMFEALPHTVGSVTNLDGDLALRALTSLRAEIEYRMRLITHEHNCKDITEIWEKHPSKAPPSLVLVFDEFATLVKEVPEFINGVVDVAQRGRSLGVHLILATQRPSGAINENIQANTNIRIALRMVDAAESSSVLGAPDAADIPVPLRGRGFVRLGPKQVLPFQSAYTGASSAEVSREPVVIRPLGSDAPLVGGGTAGGETQGARVVNEIVALWAQLGRTAPRQPWRPDLPEVLPREDLATCITSSTTDFVLGILDDPKRQAQPLAVWDSRSTTSLMVFGSSKSGKTMLLRNMGRTAADQHHRSVWNLVTIDLGTRGLDALKYSSNTVLTANADDLESVTRALRYLQGEVAHRRTLLAEHACADYEQLSERVENLPRLLVLVDDFQNFGGTFGGSAYGSQVPEIELAMFITNVSDSGACGVHFVIGADRRSSIRSTLHSAIPSRIVLRQGDEMGYFDFGINIARGSVPKLPAGRGFWLDDKRVQFASDAGEQAADNRAVSEERAGLVAPKLPAVLQYDAKASYPRVVVGVVDVTHQELLHDLSRQPLLVLGPRGSGRTTALRWLASQSKSAHIRTIRSTADLIGLKKEHLLVIDDADVHAPQIEDVAVLEAVREIGCRMVFAINTRNSNNLGFGWLRDLARDAAYLVLQPDDRNCQNVMSMFFDRLPYLRPGLEYPPGRGVFSAGRTSTVVQVPLAGDRL
jgi:S-DNA-T family DNA segregation ATPase FtsK/SpoIIIE